MPAVYAHFKFGEAVYRGLPDEKKQIIDKYRELFDIGLYGPDIFFYYHPVFRNKVSSIAFTSHETSGFEFFESMGKVILSKGEQEPYYAYYYGFLCHYVLDCACHKCVYRTIKENHIAHFDIEGDFERTLMIGDGLDPIRHVTIGHLVPSQRNAEVIADFFENATAKNVIKCLHVMKRCNRILAAPGYVKRFFIRLVFRLSGHYRDLKGFLINRYENRKCAASTKELITLMDNAIPDAIRSISISDRVIDGSESFDKSFCLDFDGFPDDDKSGCE